MNPTPQPPRPSQPGSPLAGFAHVATLGFLAGRIVPPLGFPAALAGGTALARAGQVRGLRGGYAAAAAAMIELVATVGPSRLGGPASQAITAPLVGFLQARETPASMRVLACAGLRLAYNSATTALFIFVLSGGLDVYATTYEHVSGFLGFLPSGRLASLATTLIVLLGWALVAAVVQVAVIDRALRQWRSAASERGGKERTGSTAAGRRPLVRFDPRAATLAAGLLIAILLFRHDWQTLAICAAWLAIASLVGSVNRRPFREGIVFALALGGLAMIVGAAGGQPVSSVLQLGLRAALIVIAAAWLRAATGTLGFREVALRCLGSLQRIPGARETAVILGDLGVERHLGVAIRRLARRAQSAPRNALAKLDAVLGWSAIESSSYSSPAPSARIALHLLPRDGILLLSVVAPALAWLA